MLNTIVIAEDPLAPETWESFEHEGDIRPFLTSKFESFPQTARIYHNQVSEANDVTPLDEEGIEKLGKLQGMFYVVVHAGDTISLVNAGIALFAVAVNNIFAESTPDIPNISARNVQSESPNNSLSDRQNTQRINGRIPDIFGTVTSTPDLLSVPYRVYENSVEVEYAYMCVGKGEFFIQAESIKDDSTPVEDILGSSIEVYYPNMSPNFGTAQLTIGDAITEPLFKSTKSNAVNGQLLNPINGPKIFGASNIKFVYPNIIEAKTGTTTDINFLDLYAQASSIEVTNVGNVAMTLLGAGVSGTFTVSCNSLGQILFNTPSDALNFSTDEIITLSGAVFSYGGGSVDLNGDYLVDSSTSGIVSLVDPEKININWTQIEPNFVGNVTGTASVGVANLIGTVVKSFNLSRAVALVTKSQIFLDFSNFNVPAFMFLKATSTDETAYLSPNIDLPNDPKYIGPFDLLEPDLTELLLNFVAPNGLYKDDGTNQYQENVDIVVQLVPIDLTGTPIGSMESFSETIEGSSVTRSQRSLSMRIAPSTLGPQRVSVYRSSITDYDFNGQVVDEVKWKDLYAMSEITDADFGDVTTVYSKTIATEGALAGKSRKLNMEVTRKVPHKTAGTNFTVTKFPTKRADQIISFVCLDPKIGNRAKAEIDFDNIYSTVQEVEDYFGTSKAVEFNYTFDKENLSFEETLISICKAIHCRPYRQGNQIKINFEKETPDSLLLFNHRNKIPGSETRSLRFGNVNEFDGVELEYTDPTTDLIETFYIPTDKSAINPKKIETLGIRDKLQAHFHAYRAWNKIRYQNLATEFEATQEANLVTIGDRILVADGTRDQIQDGEVVSQNGLELTLSQEVDFTGHASYKIFLQHYDGTVESLDITAGTGADQVILGQAPKQALALDPELFAVTTYLIVGNTEQAFSAFLVSEKSPQGNFTSVVSAVNYDSRYYQNDLDYDNGIVDIDGNLL